jgi:hypothetical protein
LLKSLKLLMMAASSSGATCEQEAHVPGPATAEPPHVPYNGAVLGLGGDIPVSILWYGRFTPAQKVVASDFPRLPLRRPFPSGGVT